jgi:hypothetical protein
MLPILTQIPVILLTTRERQEEKPSFTGISRTNLPDPSRWLGKVSLLLTISKIQTLWALLFKPILKISVPARHNRKTQHVFRGEDQLAMEES